MSRPRLQLPGRGGCWPLLPPLSALADPGRHPGRCLSTGELKTGSAATRFRRKRRGENMEEEFSHLPVMAREVVELFLPVPGGMIVDCTVGGGGHSAALLDARPDVHV